MRRETVSGVILPPLLFAAAIHAVFRAAFGADPEPLRPAVVIAFQALLFACWLLEWTSASFTITGAALAALLIEVLSLLRQSLPGGFTGRAEVMGAAAASAASLALLYASYRLATTPGYWFNQDAKPALPGPIPEQDGRSGARKGAGPSPRFVLVDADTGRLLAQCRRRRVKGTLDGRVLGALLPHLDPLTLRVVEVSWPDASTVRVAVRGRSREPGEHYRVLEPEEGS